MDNADASATAPIQKAEYGRPGADYVGRDKIIFGDEIGRDKIINHGHLIIQQALSAVEEARRAQEFEAAQLAQGVNNLVQRLLARLAPPPFIGQSGPYLGLTAYQLGDAEIFFGREHAIEAIGMHLRRSNLTILQAESGAGKTSLLHAGIAPRLLTGGHLPVIVRPYDQPPTYKIKEVFLPSLAQTPELAAATLREFLLRVSMIVGRETSLFVILDQFEEFFTLRRDTETPPTFVNDLAECLDDPGLNVCWILAIRSDFFGDLAAFRPRIRNPFDNDYRLNRLTLAEAKAIIIRPVAPLGITYEPVVVDQILADLVQHEHAIAPPQLQLVCLALYEAYWEQQKADPTYLATIGIDLYNQEGGTSGILKNHLNRALTRTFQSERKREIARGFLTALVSSNQRRLRLTREVLCQQVASPPEKSDEIATILDDLISQRLISVEQRDQDVDAIYELTHDYLLDEIQLDPVVQLRKLAQELLDQAVKLNQLQGFLLRSEQYAFIVSQHAFIRVDPRAEELLRKSQDAIEKEQRKEQAARIRRIRIRTAYLTAITLLLLPALYIGANAGMFYLRRTSAWQQTLFPADAVTSIATAYPDGAPLICVGTADIGIGCSADMQTWNVYQAGLPSSTPAWFNDRTTLLGSLTSTSWSTTIRGVAEIAFDLANPQKIYVQIDEAGLFVSTTGGVSWKAVASAPEGTEQIPRIDLKRLYVYDQDILLLYASSIYADLSEEQRGALYSSADGGYTWHLRGGSSLRTGPLSDMLLVVNAVDRTKQVYATTKRSLLRASIAEHWVWKEVATVDEGNIVQIAADTRWIYLATYDRERNSGVLYRWRPGAGSHAIPWSTYSGGLRKIATDPTKQEDPSVWLLFENSEVMSVDPSGKLVYRGKRPGWLWSFPHDLALVQALDGAIYPLMGHRDGLLAYCPPPPEQTCLGAMPKE